MSKIDEKLVAPPTTHIAGTFWGIVDLLHATLRLIASEDGANIEIEKTRRTVLDNTELLMHRCSTLDDYLGKLLNAALEASKDTKISSYLVKKSIDYRVEKLFKMPVNLLKHNSFGLSWIEMVKDSLVTQGYSLTGPVGGNQYAPAKFRPKDKTSPEAYSFSLVYRDLFLSVYEICDIAESALERAKLFDETVGSPNTNDSRSHLIHDTLELLNILPMNCFPDEHRIRVPIFSMHENSIYFEKKPLRKFPGVFQIRTELRSVGHGISYKLPYFQGSD